MKVQGFATDNLINISIAPWKDHPNNFVIEIYANKDVELKWKKPVVNWSAVGSVEPDKAAAFAEAMNVAVKLAERPIEELREAAIKFGTIKFGRG